MEVRTVDEKGVQKTRRKENKAYRLETGSSCFYHGVGGKRNRGGVILKEFSKNIQMVDSPEQQCGKEAKKSLQESWNVCWEE